MTLPDLMKNSSMLQSKPKNIDIGIALRECIWRALDENRLTCGLFECAKLLKCKPDSVMLCVLPEVTGQHDVTVGIHHTLIEAFCWENDIRLLKVKQQNSLGRILNGRHDGDDAYNGDDTYNGDDADVGNVNTAMSKVNVAITMTTTKHKSMVDSSCILLEHPKTGQSEEEEDVIEYYNFVIQGDTYPKPTIEFPE